VPRPLGYEVETRPVAGSRRPLLAANDPVGSVALTLSDRGVVWVNVFRVARPNRLNETREVLERRVVRWFPAPA
jgi:hypothetical protein